MITPHVSRAFRFKQSFLLAATLGALAINAPAQTLLSHYTLDGSGNDTGSVAVNGTLKGDASFGAAGTGVGSFNQAFSTGDGSNDYFSALTGGNAAFGLNAITVALWVNIDSGATSDRLVSNITGTSGFDLFLNNYSAGTGAGGADAFRLTFAINGTSGGNGVTSINPQYVSDKWLFIAVTYDSANVRFYSGSETLGLVLNDTVAKTGSIAASASNLEIGGTPATTNDRSPAALFNDVRIYDGALSLSEIEAIRASAVIPEPSNMALIIGALLTGFIATKRRLKR